MVQSRRSRRNPFIRSIQRHARVSVLDARTLVATGTPAASPSPNRAASGFSGGAVPIDLQRSSSASRLTWNRTGRTPVPMVMASLATTPAPWYGEDELFVEETAAAAAGGEESQAAESGLEPTEWVQPSQVGRLPSGGFDDKPQPEMAALSRSAQKPPELAMQKPVQSSVLPVKLQAEESSSKQGSVEKQAGAENLSPQEDGVWKRLQTIFRKHEEKRHESDPSAEIQSNRTSAGEGVSEPHEEEMEKKEDGEPRLAAEAPEQAAALEAGVLEFPLNTAGTARTPGTQEPWKGNVPGKSETAGESMPESQFSGQRTSEEKLTPPGPGKGEDITNLARVQSLENESVTDTPNEAVLSRLPVMTHPGSEEAPPARTEAMSTSASKTPVSTPLGEAVERFNEGIPSKEPAPAEFIVKKPVEPQPPRKDVQRPQVTQSLPLEAVWPVQRQTSPRAQQEQQNVFGDGYIGNAYIGDHEHVLPSEKKEAPLEILGQEEHVQVREALREVSPGRPTDSSVEVITPRHRRPVHETELGLESPEKGSPGEHEQMRLAPELEPIAAAPGKKIPGKDFVYSSEGVLMAAEDVETEIGPLPADLWELIGESPQAAQPQPIQTASPAISGKPVQRESFAPQNGKKMPEAPAGFVQKQPAESGAAASTGASGAAVATESQAGQPQAEIDMDELARRVYGEVKKRLALEWERMRRRL